MAKDDDKIADLFRWFDETIKEVEELFYDDEEEILDDDVMDFTSEYPSVGVRRVSFLWNVLLGHAPVYNHAVIVDYHLLQSVYR